MLTYFFVKGETTIAKELQINEQIKDKEVRLIASDGSAVGVVTYVQAMALADEEGLDLVKISPMAIPPVCKIMDYGKYKFELQKKLKEAKKNQKIVEVKEIQFTMRIDTNDLMTKIKHAKKFLEDGNKVKVVLKMQGREQANVAKAIDNTKQFYELLKDDAVLDKPAEKLGRNVIMILAPIKK